MKPPSVSLLFGAAVLLLCGLTVTAVVSFVPPFSPTRSLIQLVVIVPYFIATVQVYSALSRMKPSLPKAESMEMSHFIEGAQEFQEDYDDIAADVTTEYEF